MYRTNKAIYNSTYYYKEEILNQLKENTGYSLAGGSDALKTCSGQQNDTVMECPINEFAKNNSEFIVLVHNQQARSYKQFVRVKLPS